MCITTQEGSSCPQQVAEPLALLALLAVRANTTVYVPRAVAFLNATHEGGGGIEETQEYALRMGAKELKMGEQGLLVATWPQEYWEIEAGQECPCGARGCAGRPKGGYKPSVRRV